MERKLFVLAACAFIVAAVFGSAWITGQFTTPEVDRTEGIVGELAARDQPWTRLFRVSDATSGLACAFGVALVPRVVREWPGWLALAGFGLLTLVAAVFPLDCAMLSDPFCGRRGVSLGHLAHVAAGALAMITALVAMVLLSVRWQSWVSWLFTWLGLVATALTGAALMAGRGAGLAHRAQLTMIAIWLVYVALRLLIADEDDLEPDDGLTGPYIPQDRLTGPHTPRDRLPGAYGREGGQAGPYLHQGEQGGVGAPYGGPPGVWAGRRGADPVARHGIPYVVTQGSGPTVLIAAGPAGAWFHWDAVAARLARTHHVIRFDRPGLGLSPRPPAPPTLFAEAARLAALSPAHPEQVTIIAHGVACWHAEAFARLHPLCLARLVLVDPARVTERAPLHAARAAGRWMPALGGTWGATVLARLTGPAAHRLLTGLPDPLGVYRMGKVPAAVAGEWLARRDMAADLCRLRADRPFPDVPVTVISAGRRNGCRTRLADDLDAEHVRVRGPGRRIHLRNPQAVADAAQYGGLYGGRPAPNV